jgi:[protein-PII] uridylyltransferase
VHDPDYAEAPPAERLEEVTQALVQSLKSPHGSTPAFRQVWRPGNNRDRTVFPDLPARVRIDNSTSDRFTILDIFARDRLGLLFTISRTLFEMNLSVAVAKIGTYLDQVVDVFYVTDQSGKKISDEARLQEVNATLIAAIDGMDTG